MALKPCPECNREISNQASVCPGCGYEQPLSQESRAIRADRERKKQGAMLLGFLCAMIGVGMICWWSWGLSEFERAASQMGIWGSILLIGGIVWMAIARGTSDS